MEGEGPEPEPGPGSGAAYLLQCGRPTLYGGLSFAKDVLLTNVCFHAAARWLALPDLAKHNLSLLLGSFLLYNSVGFAFLWTAGLTAASYFSLMALTLAWKRRRGLVTSALVVAFLLHSEYLVADAKMWQQIRGIQMIAAMKIISVGIDLDNGYAEDAPSPAEFAGYVMCPANCILGPWASYDRYARSLENKSRFHSGRRWLESIAANAALALLALFLSNCFVPWYIPDDASRWLVAYRDAQSFRASHYFVSVMSQAFMISGRYGDRGDGGWSVRVTDPLRIELPRSLVQAVVYWNAPTHRWLKTYVFNVCKPRGKFVAVFATYAVSSLLHGLNFQLSAVLLSIGAFSYVECKIRAALADALSMCCLANPCSKSCGHALKKGETAVTAVNGLFALLAVFHLAYLGVMFEASFAVQETGYSYAHTLKKWADLHFASHIVAVVTYVVYLLI